jgi:serine/threonine protein kinase
MQVLDRIMRVDFRIPKYPRISPECRDLLMRILVGDPDQRLTIAQIQKHPWCARGALATGLATGLLSPAQAALCRGSSKWQGGATFGSCMAQLPDSVHWSWHISVPMHGAENSGILHCMTWEAQLT